MNKEQTLEFLSKAADLHASDIFIIAGRPLSIKTDGRLSTYGDRLMPEQTSEILEAIYQMANNRDISRLHNTGDDDFSFSIPGLSRFRINAYKQRGSLAAVIRVIAFQLPDPAELSIPEDVMSIADLTKGMVLVTGSAGSGKIHNHGLPYRSDQPFSRRAYHYAGRSSGIPASTRSLYRKPA